MNKAYDTIIIGGGPAGLSAAIYASRLGLKTLLIDRGPSGGALGSASKIENFPGLSSAVSGKELLAMLRRQAERFGAEFLDGAVTGAELNSDPKKITAGSRVFEAKTAVIAAGAKGKKAGIKGEKEFGGKGVSYCAACDAPFYRGKDVILTGSTSKIIEELDTVSRFAAKVYIVIPSAVKIEEKNAFEGKAALLEKHRPVEIHGDKFVTGLKVKDSKGAEKDIPASGVFVYSKGSGGALDFIKDKIELEDDGCISADPRTMATSIEGVYGAGDVTCTRFRQAVIAAAEGCRAALSAESLISKRTTPRKAWH